jgi:hypothetical protein
MDHDVALAGLLLDGAAYAGAGNAGARVRPWGSDPQFAQIGQIAKRI